MKHKNTPTRGLCGILRRLVQAGKDYFEHVTGNVFTGDDNVTAGDVSGNQHVQHAGEDIVEGNKTETTLSNVSDSQVASGNNIRQTQVHIYPPADSPATEEQAALQEAYLNQLFEKCGQVLLSGIDRQAVGQETQTCLKLSSIYTALLTLSTEHDLGKRDAPFQQDREPGRRISAVDQLNQHKRLVLLGDPGSGKSTFVNFVTLCLAGGLLHNPQVNIGLLTAPLPNDEGQDEEKPQSWTHGFLLPVRVVLRDFAAEGLPSAGEQATAKHLWEFLVRTLKETAFGDYAPLLRRHLLETGGLVLLDGLDEVSEAHARRTQLKTAIEDFARSFPKCRIVVTSRTYAYQEQDWQLADFRKAELAPFTAGQIIRFVDQWYQQSAELLEMRPDDTQGRAELLKRAIFGSDRLRDFARRPLLLTLMASLHAWRGGSLPEKRAELYNDAVELLLDRWESRKVKDVDGRLGSLTEVLKLGPEGMTGLRRAISALAYEAHAAQPELIGTADIPGEKLGSVLRYLSQRTEVNPNKLEEYLRDRAGLLVEHGIDVYTFPHRTFQEYLAACYLTETTIDGYSYPANAARLAREDPNRWREVMLLSAAKAAGGYSSAIWGIAEALYQKDIMHPDITPADAWGALLAGQIIQESADLTQISDWDRPKLDLVKSWLAAILTEQVPKDSPFPAVERALAGNILAQIGDPRLGVGLREDGLPDIVWCEVPAGPFLMGSDPEKDPPEKIVERILQDLNWGDDRKNAVERWVLSEQPQHNVLLSSYQISRYPVTHAQYQVFIDAGGYTEKWKACWTEDGWAWKEAETSTAPDLYGGEFDVLNHPIVGVSWYEATAFCHWLTYKLRECGELTETQEIRLPTEAEWEKAARGDDGRIYPWGDEIISEHANYGDTGLGTTSAVGCFPRGKSPYGCEEMTGNVYEWCVDWYDEEYYAQSPEKEPRGPASGSDRVIRGGNWNLDAGYVRAAYRNWNAPDDRYYVIGFRLVRTPS